VKIRWQKKTGANQCVVLANELNELHELMAGRTICFFVVRNAIIDFH
jgi:hypothetical protein